MGRVVDAHEHNMPGVVTIGRPVRSGMELPPQVELLRQKRLAEIQHYKETGSFVLATAVEIETHTDPCSIVDIQLNK